MLPEGWCSEKLDNLVDAKIVYGIVQAGPQVEGGVPYIRSTDVGGSINVENLLRTSDEIHQRYCRSAVQPADIVLSLRGNIGEVSQVPEGLPVANLTQGTARIRTKERIDAKFLLNALRAVRMQRQIHAKKKGSTFKEITLEDLRKCVLDLPKCNREQTKVAEIFTTWDQAIETVDKLIDNARARKKALMQQLLTGQRRLPGFEGRHVELPLTEVTTIKTGDSNKQDSVDDGPYIFFDRSTEVRRSHQYLFDTEAVIVGGEGQEFVPKYFAGKFDLHQRAYAIQGFDRCFGRYIFHLVNHQRHLLRRFAVGSTVPSLRMASFEKIPVPMLDLDEQKAIAGILDSADREVDVLCDQKVALQTEKRALMQQLLTGKRRVQAKGVA